MPPLLLVNHRVLNHLRQPTDTDEHGPLKNQGKSTEEGPEQLQARPHRRDNRPINHCLQTADGESVDDPTREQGVKHARQTAQMSNSSYSEEAEFDRYSCKRQMACDTGAAVREVHGCCLRCCR